MNQDGARPDEKNDDFLLSEKLGIPTLTKSQKPLEPDGSLLTKSQKPLEPDGSLLTKSQKPTEPDGSLLTTSK
jgi:hypothetical protein